MTQSAESLQPYLPRLVRYWDLDAPGESHRAIDGSMVFVDISGFTKLSERLARHGNEGAEEVTAVIDETFAELLPEAYQHGANLLKFGGDALLLWFSGPRHAVRAAASAYAMRHKLRSLGPSRAGGVTLRMTSGVHSASFDFFLVGKSHRELIVAGPAVTRTVEMETAADSSQIMVSRETAALLPPEVLGSAVGSGYLLRRPIDIEPVGFLPSAGGEGDLRQFIPAALCTTLTDSAVHPEHRPAAVGFIHFGGFDRFLLDRGGAAAATELDHLVGAVQSVAEESGVSFLATDIADDGGKVILTAGVPDTSGNDEEQMLLAARRLLNSVETQLALQVGINAGNVFAGSVGPPYRKTYTVMGDTVNLAARLMARAPVGQIFAHAPVLDASRTLFLAEPLPPFQVKGKARAIHAVSVGQPQGSRAAEEGASLPLVGRAKEMAAIEQAWRSALAGEGQVIEIVADAGLGKTRLLEEVLAATAPERLARAESRLYQTATPYFPFRIFLRSVWGLDAVEPEAVAGELRALVRKHAPDLEAWVPLIGVPLGLDLPPTPEVTRLEDEFRQARTISAVVSLLQATVTQPTLVIFEDNHWMDNASRELLARLLEVTPVQPWLFILTRRPGDRGFVAPEETSTRLELQPITAADARRLIEEATIDAPLRADQVQVLAERAQGSPLFLIELLRAIRRGGDPETLPHSVEGLIAARIDRLNPDDRNLLRRVAVLGNGFKIEHAEVVVPNFDLRAMFRAGKRLGDFISIDRSRDWVQFRHVLIRDVAYAGLPFKTRRDLHARVGDSICGGRENPEGDAALLSNHYSRARRWDEAWRFSRLAGDGASDIYANLEAATLYRRALNAAKFVDSISPAEKAKVSIALGDALHLAGRFEESVEAYSNAIQYVRGDPVRQSDIYLKRAKARARTGGYKTAYGEITKGQRLVGSLRNQEGLKAHARLTAQKATTYQLQERPLDALKTALQAKAEAAEAGEDEALAQALRTLDASHIMLGQLSKATHSENAIEIYERLGKRNDVAIITLNLGAAAYFEGRWDETLARYQKARELFEEVGNYAEAASAGANIGELLVSQGKLEEAEEVLTESVRTLRAHNLLDVAIFAEIQLARLRLMQGSPDAIGALQAVREEAQTARQYQSAIEASIYLAQALVQAGKAGEALALLADARASHADAAEIYACQLARVSATALVALGRTAEAAAEVSAGLEQARAEGLVYEEALLLRVAADLPFEQNREKKLEEARGLLQQLGVLTEA